jgi:hypothetical protein
MFTVDRNTLIRIAALLGLMTPLPGGVGFSVIAAAQAAPAAAPAAGPKLGTVTAVTPTSITIKTDAGPTVTISVPDGAKVQQLAVGSTDLKTATPSQMSEVAVGDRVLAAVKPGDTADSFVASRVVLMKSGDIAQKNAADQADWRRNGTGGIVSAVDPSGAITVTVGAKKVTVTTSAKTDFRRFTGDSVKFQDAKSGTFSQITVGDQIQARGTKSADGATVDAAQVVSGSFKNLSGVIANLDATGGKVTIKDLATKKTYNVTVTANSDIRALPPQMAQMFASRSAAGAGAGASSAPAGPPAGGGGAGAPGGPGGPGGARRPGGGGGDLASMITRLPTAKLADLKNGAAVMIVASEPTPGAINVTAVTLLTGVEPILTANPNGGMNLSGWSMGGGGAPE